MAVAKTHNTLDYTNGPTVYSYHICIPHKGKFQTTFQEWHCRRYLLLYVICSETIRNQCIYLSKIWNNLEQNMHIISNLSNI